MRSEFISVPQEADGLRADVFIAESLQITRSAAQKLLDAGLVSNSTGSSHGTVEKNRRVKTGDIFKCEIPEPVPHNAAPEDIPLNIAYEDSHLLVVDKPRGLVVHPAAGHHAGTLVNALLFHCRLSEIGGVLRPGIVHRLDKDTSGLMVVAKTDEAHVALAAQLEKHEMGRTYNAICHGAIKKDRLRIDLPIGRHPRDRKKMAVPASPGARARNAATNIEVLERFSGGRGGNFTLIAAKLETGRTHQIRVHMAHIGHPVLGDTVYGPARPAFDLQGQILHAVRLRFTHPATGEEMEFESPLPEYFLEAKRLVIGG